MIEVFYEESAKVNDANSAKKKYNTFYVLSIIFFTLSVLWFFIAYNIPFTEIVIIDIVYLATPFLIFVPTGVFFFIYKNKFYVDYDYSFSSGTIKVAKVIKEIKRRFVLKFDASSIEKMGKKGSNTYFKYESMSDVKKMTFTMNEQPATGKDFYYLVATVNAEKKLMIFECTETFMVNVLKFANKSIIEEDFE